MAQYTTAQKNAIATADHHTKMHDLKTWSELHNHLDDCGAEVFMLYKKFFAFRAMPWYVRVWRALINDL